MKRGLVFLMVLAAGAAVAPAQEEYAGPAVLSRGVGQYGGGSAGSEATFRWFLGSSGSYSTELTPVSVTSTGDPVQFDTYGGELTAGVYVNKRFARSNLGLFYRAAYTHYGRDQYLNGVGQSFGLNYSKRASRRVEVSVFSSAAAGNRVNTGFGGFNTPGLVGGALGMGWQSYMPISLTPENDFFDNQGFLVTGGGALTFVASSRLSLSASVAGSTTQRHSRALIDTRGAMGQGDVAYRISRRHTIGVTYSVGQYWYPNAEGMMRMQSVGFLWSARLNRYWQLGVNAGGYRMSSEYVRQVQADPLVAAILGTSTSLELAKGTVYQGGGSVALSGSFRRSGVNFAYVRGVTAGNSLLYGGPREGVSAGYSYAGLRRVSLHVGANASQMTPYLQNAGRARFFSAYAGAGTRLLGDLHFNVNGGVWRNYIQRAGFDRTSAFVAVGLTYSPGETPLIFW